MSAGCSVLQYGLKESEKNPTACRCQRTGEELAASKNSHLTPDRISSYGNTGPNGAYCIAQSRTPTNLSLEYQTAGSMRGPIRSNIRRA
jgi:hypothetical protein